MAYNLTGIIFPILFTLSTIAHAYDLTLAWDPNDEPDLAGYTLYVNEVDSGPPYNLLDTFSINEIEPNNPAYTVTGLKENSTYCFVLTAYSTEGFESDFSNEVCVLGGQAVTLNLSQLNRGGGGGCFISSCRR